MTDLAQRIDHFEARFGVADLIYSYARYIRRDEPEKITCNTGAPVSSSTVGLRSAPGAETAKLVAFSTTSGATAAKAARTSAMEAGSLRLETKTGKARTPSAARASIIISTGRVSPLWT